MAWVVFISVGTWASTKSALLALLGRLRRARSRLRSDECVYVLLVFDFFTFPTYAINEDMRMRGYEIWDGDAGEDVYECNGYGHGIKRNVNIIFGFQHSY